MFLFYYLEPFTRWPFEKVKNVLGLGVKPLFLKQMNAFVSNKLILFETVVVAFQRRHNKKEFDIAVFIRRLFIWFCFCVLTSVLDNTIYIYIVVWLWEHRHTHIIASFQVFYYRFSDSMSCTMRICRMACPKLELETSGSEFRKWLPVSLLPQTHGRSIRASVQQKCNRFPVENCIRYIRNEFSSPVSTENQHLPTATFRFE